MKFVIFAAPYDELRGGHIVMHYLCHLLNQSGGQAYLFPRFENHLVNALDYENGLQQLFLERAQFKSIYSNSTLYKVNKDWNTPLFQGKLADFQTSDDVIVVYAEWTFGNPLRARNVARWILHNPGFHRKESFFSNGEVQFLMHSGFNFLSSPWLRKADFYLPVTFVPVKLYHSDVPLDDPSRTLVTYCMRKGRSKPLIHDALNSVCIDSLSHNQISELFKKSKLFISYDTRTFFSNLAVLSGVTSVVIPDKNADGSDHPKPRIFNGTGVAWGFDDIEIANSERPAGIEKLMRSEAESKESVYKFMAFWEKEIQSQRASRA